MSDFDKEAEREKLREKYEEEEAKREATEQMSELLLKGATMTNAHCSDCGDPIFRYDGQEFCPTCEKPVDRGEPAGDRSGGAGDQTTDQTGGADERGAGEEANAAGQAGTDATESAGANGVATGDGIEVTTPSDDASVRFGGDDGGDAAPSADERTGRSADERADRTTDDADEDDDVRQVPSAAPNDAPAHDAPAHDAPASNAPAGGQSDANERPDPSGAEVSPGTAAGSSPDEHLGRAQVVLAQTVERYANLAAAADSPREARDHLETAREAAETLDATEF